ncbi:MAG: hypothetical protein BWX46_00846 [Candidatus Cloacimonetes bacterium ADurb.Bin003]|nr:MAG: hypothetical protein BWX46_00846 [Candidatus Cloacimonetes bacterium ADurb.Bin003]
MLFFKRATAFAKPIPIAVADASSFTFNLSREFSIAKWSKVNGTCVKAYSEKATKPNLSLGRLFTKSLATLTAALKRFLGAKSIANIEPLISIAITISTPLLLKSRVFIPQRGCATAIHKNNKMQERKTGYKKW